MKNEKKQNPWLAVFLVIVIIGLIGFIVYDKVLKDSLNTSDFEQLDINTPLVKQLYDSISINTDNSEYDVYVSLHRSKEITNKTLDSESKMIITTLQFMNANLQVIDKEDYSEFSIDKKAFEDKYLSLFGESNNITTFKSENDMLSGKLKSGKYVITVSVGHGGGNPSYYKIIKAEKNDKELNIYSNYLSLEGAPIGEKVFADSEQSIIVVENVDDLMANYSDESGKYMERVARHYEEYTKHALPEYKHNFKKDANGNYYWYSTKLLSH